MHGVSGRTCSFRAALTASALDSLSARVALANKAVFSCARASFMRSCTWNTTQTYANPNEEASLPKEASPLSRQQPALQYPPTVELNQGATMSHSWRVKVNVPPQSKDLLPVKMATEVAIERVASPDDVSPDSPTQQSTGLIHTEETAVQFGKPKAAFRVYGTGSAPREALVTRHYTLMRSNQTVDFVNKMEEKVCVHLMVVWQAVDGVRFATCELRFPTTIARSRVYGLALPVPEV
jgi:hypothetical protein